MKQTIICWITFFIIISGINLFTLTRINKSYNQIYCHFMYETKPDMDRHEIEMNNDKISLLIVVSLMCSLSTIICGIVSIVFISSVKLDKKENDDEIKSDNSV